MYSTTALIIAVLIGVAAGAAIAIFALRNSSDGGDRARAEELEERLKDADSKLEDFQLQVNEHFQQTSELVRNLTDSYREVHEYLANSALRLSSQDIGRSMLEAGESPAQIAQDADIQPPRDWAPKEPGAKGTLAEDFGMEEERAPQPPHTEGAAAGRT
ncbi:YhcB family protein [Biformimicrobium ophioploci]|uniref:Z-ring associated protein G n=1 Tax=Biformimicrobium ophioploci TaxID=3036711 RepID=A0ABQ6LWY2_9GAMM|nr:DUF1043 family protein [Microbulbifer sp. NKW57]GMG86613.1 hypothetical protein MNKW57_09340 [Microbulbifer sp. NKW57]